MRPKLIITAENEAQKEFVLSDSGEYILGRDVHADIQLPERKISRKHAVIYWDAEKDDLKIKDMGSLNGTFLNGTPIKELSALHHGDQIRIGPYHLLVDYPRNHVSGIDFSSVINLEPMRTQPDSHLGSSESPSSAEIQFQRLSSAEAMEETGGRLISGKLQELSLPDVLQMLATTRKSGILTISSEKLLRLPSSTESKEVAKISIKNGEVLNAEFMEYTQEEAFYRILEFETGYFALFPLDSSFEIDAAIQMPLEMLLLEGMRRLDEKKAQAEELQPEDILEPQPDEPLTHLNPEELKVFQLAWKYHKVSDIIAHATDSPLEVEEILKKLVRNRFLKKRDQGN